MAARQRTRTSTARRRETPRATLRDVRLVVEYLGIDEVIPYENNARFNQQAVEAVRQSIRQFGFNNPVIVDDDNVLVAGHTRTEAARLEGYMEIPVIRAHHLTPEQVQAFRLVDNKVAELAEWDDQLLAQELEAIGNIFDFTDFGWTQADLDCLGELVSDDCLSTAGLVSDAPAGEVSRLPERRAATQTRIVIGDFVFFRPTASVRNWLDGLRRLHNADQEAIAADIAERLRFLE